MKPGPFCVDKMCRNRYTRRCSILSESFWLTPGRNVLLASKEPESENNIFFASWSTSRSTIQVGCRSCMVLWDHDWITLCHLKHLLLNQFHLPTATDPPKQNLIFSEGNQSSDSKHLKNIHKQLLKPIPNTQTHLKPFQKCETCPDLNTHPQTQHGNLSPSSSILHLLGLKFTHLRGQISPQRWGVKSNNSQGPLYIYIGVALNESEFHRTRVSKGLRGHCTPGDFRKYQVYRYTIKITNKVYNEFSRNPNWSPSSSEPKKHPNWETSHRNWATVKLAWFDGWRGIRGLASQGCYM